MTGSTGRAWRAACPNCGAPVEFASAASASAVCSFCRSTLVRDGEALRRIGVSSELFDNHSPLQLGAVGRWQGLAFTLIGEVQWRYPEGIWNEWHALFDNGKSGWLSEDNGAYVMGFEAPRPADAPDPLVLQAGQRVPCDGRAWDVASVVAAEVLAAAGELPAAPRTGQARRVVDLRNSQGEVATLEEGSSTWFIGKSARLAELSLQGLRDGPSEKTLQARSFPCPSCGAALAPKLATTQSLSCEQCKAVVDVSKGVGAELAHYAQNNSGPQGVGPQIALGSSGLLALGASAPVRWQVVGFLERMELAGAEDDEQTFWREYLLYEQKEGFAFLVDAQDGWSWMRPLTGVPTTRGQQAQHAGVSYQRRYSYGAAVTWVQGEFYWRIQRGERAHVTDFSGTGGDADKRMSREQTGNEVTWSAGATLSGETVADAFAIAPAGRAALQRDVPLAASSSLTWDGIQIRNALIMLVVALIVISIISSCSGDRCDDLRDTFGAASAEYQQCVRSAGTGSGMRGGSFGGWSGGGGGHK